MPLGMFENLIHMDLENHIPVQMKAKGKSKEGQLTSEKVRQVLARFPSSRPITSDLGGFDNFNGYPCLKCMATNYKPHAHPIPQFPWNPDTETVDAHRRDDQLDRDPGSNQKSRAWTAVTEAMQLLQLMVAATAFTLYYFIYGWMQVLYHGLRVAMYFKHADGPMKITLGVVATTAVVVCFNMLLRLRRIYYDIIR